MNAQNQKPKEEELTPISGFGFGASFGFRVSGFGFEFPATDRMCRPDVSPRLTPTAAAISIFGL
jgi:hypothetical protein